MLDEHPEQALYFELALRLGYAHPRYLLQRLSSSDLTEWLAYLGLERERQAEERKALYGK